MVDRAAAQQPAGAAAEPSPGQTTAPTAGAPASASQPPTPQPPQPEAVQQLLRLRASIDNIDAALIHLLAERFKCTQAVGQLKAEHNLPPSDPQREARQIERLKQLAADAHLNPEFAEKWFNFVVAEVIQHHRQIAAQDQQV
ncbi:chorismate mutase [Leucobacter sp. OH2974_COT-288]|nr:chorismate mutase [Leucobacter sp. OH2974_COT-288]